MDFRSYQVPYSVSEQYSKRVAYFSMEIAIHQPLKIYSGGLGFLAGSHLRSAYELRQNMIAIGIFWKYGYYDQVRQQDQSLKPTWIEKTPDFLEDTGIKFQIDIHGHSVWVKALYLNPETFNSAPLFLLTTDLPENDYLSQTITHRLYDANTSTKLAQFILLGIGGAKLIDELNFNPEVYHLNEAHGISAAFYLLKKLGDAAKLKDLLVFTTHTPEEAGNEKHDMETCHKMGYFYGYNVEEVKKLTSQDTSVFNHSLAALRLARKANGVSKLHGIVSRAMWQQYEDICEITSITNAQNYTYWSDKSLYQFMNEGNDEGMDDHKRYLKKTTFEIVADQTGKLFDPNILTIVWARRFAGYKRATFLTWDMERFEKLLANTEFPIQLIWAGKPYPFDYPAIDQFNELIRLSKNHPNVAVLTGYELSLSKSLKQCADVWLNNPRVPREASGTSGITAAMNGAVNLSTDDGWIPEFAKHGENSFVIPKADYMHIGIKEQDKHDLDKLYELLENDILPKYYQDKQGWRQVVKNSLRDVRLQFDSNRMVHEYYEIMYKG